MKRLRLKRAALLATLLAVSGTSFAAKAAPKRATTPAAGSLAALFLGSNGLPRVGMRIVIDSGSTTSSSPEGTRRDANGNLVDQGGNRVPEMNLDNQSGVGYTVIDIVQSSPTLVASDLSNFLRTGPNLSQIFRTGSDALQGNFAKMSDYWTNPKVLATMTSGTHGNVKVARGRLKIAGQFLNTISFSTVNANGHVNTTYDLGSGLLLFVDTYQRANPMAGNVASDQDAHVATAGHLVSVRKLGYSWASTAPPASLTVGRRLSYKGDMQMSIPGVQPMPGTPTSTVITVSKRAGLCVLAQADLWTASMGGPPLQARGLRAYGSASTDALWVPPAALAKMRNGQVLDKDPITGFQVTFQGVQNNVAAIVEQDSVQRNIRLYSTKTGLEVGSRSDTQIGKGVQTISLQLEGQG